MQDEPEDESLGFVLFVNLIIMAAVQVPFPIGVNVRYHHHEDRKETIRGSPF